MLILPGCTLGPDFTRPDAPKSLVYSPRSETELTLKAVALGKELPGQWWTLYRSPALTALIQQALKHNPDLQSAHASLIAAQEIATAKQGSLLPQLDTAGYVTRQHVSGAQFGNPSFGGSEFNLFNASVKVSYTLDIFGGIRRQIESLAAQAEYQRFQLEGTFLALTANIATTAIQEASARAQIAATQDMIAAQTEQLAVIRRQFAVGGTSQTAVLAQQAALAQTQTTLPALQQQLAQLHNRLKALTGSLPDQELATQFTLDEVQLPAELPVSLPSKLVAQRPDIRAQEGLLHAASAQIGVVLASVFPDFTINGNIGTIATQASNLFIPGSEIWNFTGNLAQPLFHGGQYGHQRKATRATYQQAAEHYRSTVLTALHNVADTLNALHYDANTVAAQNHAEQTARETLDLTKAQFQIGAVSYLDLLTAQRNHQQTRLGQIQARATQLADTAALFQALGGGWWQRPDLRQTLPELPPKRPKPASWRERLEQFKQGN